MVREALHHWTKKALNQASDTGGFSEDDICLMWLADIYKQALKVDLAEGYRGKYKNYDEAMDLLGWRGVYGALVTAANQMSWNTIAPEAADIGDLGMINTADGHAGVIKYAGDFWVGISEGGYGFWKSKIGDKRLVLRAWSVA